MENLNLLLESDDYEGFYNLIHDKRKIPQDQMTPFTKLICGLCANETSERNIAELLKFLSHNSTLASEILKNLPLFKKIKMGKMVQDFHFKAHSRKLLSDCFTILAILYRHDLNLDLSDLVDTKSESLLAEIHERMEKS